jgi:glycosyltransferase involved in cell wall biosynthesis
MHLLLVSADPALADPASDAARRHAAYARALAARRPGARLSVLAPGGRLAPDRFDAVTAQDPWSALAWRCAIARRVPFLAQLHFDPFAPALGGPADQARHLLARLAVRRAARVRVMASATAEAVARRWGVPAGRIWVAPVPIRLPEATAAREPLVVGAMRLAPDRTPSDWIDVARAVAAVRPGVRFVLAGEGKLRAGLARAAAGLPVELPGSLPPPALDALLARASLFLHTARHEAFGRAMAEAQAAGLPVVARATTGARTILRHGATGLLGETQGALVAATLALLDDPGRAAAMGKAAREGARSRFAPDLMCAGVVDFLLGERTCGTC